MTNRKYDMTGKRAEAVESTRRQIVEATMELHSSQGILATSWEQIADRAGVAPATVYRHFPTLDELLPACGKLSLELLELPDDDAIAERLGDRPQPREALDALIRELFAIYDRGGHVIWSIRRDRASLPKLQEAHLEVEERIDRMVEVALRPSGATATQRRLVRALTDYEAWTALREQGFSSRTARERLVALLAPALG